MDNKTTKSASRPLKIKKWGNSLAVRIPQSIAKGALLREGSDVLMVERQRMIVIQRLQLDGARKTKKAWEIYLMPTQRKKENVSGTIDTTLYGKSD